MKLLLVLCLLMFTNAYAVNKQKIDVLGTSSKGQFVAIEEYGYRAGTHMYFVSIRVMNVWKKEYVGDKIQVELPATRPYFLKKARAEAKELAQNTFRKYKINP